MRITIPRSLSLSIRSHALLLLGAALMAPTALLTPKALFAADEPACPGGTMLTANVVALDQVFIYNRRGAFAPGMIYALERDVVADAAAPGGWRLRDDKRPRPLTLRVNEGDCLAIHFTNLLANPRPMGSGTTPDMPPWDGVIENKNIGLFDQVRFEKPDTQEFEFFRRIRIHTAADNDIVVVILRQEISREHPFIVQRSEPRA